MSITEARAYGPPIEMTAMVGLPSAVTALISPEAAMACTAAIETEIDKHYQAQREALGDEDPDLSETIAEFQAEELEHRDTALAAGAERAVGYPVLSTLIRAGCRAAIALSKRI